MFQLLFEGRCWCLTDSVRFTNFSSSISYSRDDRTGLNDILSNVRNVANRTVPSSRVESVESTEVCLPLQLSRQKISLDCFIVPSGSIRWSTGPSLLIMIILAKGRQRGEANGLIPVTFESFERLPASFHPSEIVEGSSRYEETGCSRRAVKISFLFPSPRTLVWWSTLDRDVLVVEIGCTTCHGAASPHMQMKPYHCASRRAPTPLS